ncbi:MAG: hypothetical protein KatS3mg023_0591 [Armatimonadota bacterium]|nr:MAG: hypothetical protein KatS3mg023_0591 [Armatimonadota bacterium]
MRAYVKAVGTNITLVNIDTGEKFNVSPTAIQKLFGEELKEGEVWEFRCSRLDDIAETFRKWQAVSQA